MLRRGGAAAGFTAKATARRQSLCPSVDLKRHGPHTCTDAAGSAQRQTADLAHARGLPYQVWPAATQQPNKWGLPRAGVAAGGLLAAGAEAAVDLGAASVALAVAIAAVMALPPLAASLAANLANLRQVQLTDRLLAALNQQQGEDARVVARAPFLNRPLGLAALPPLSPHNGGVVADLNSWQAGLATLHRRPQENSPATIGSLDSSGEPSMLELLPADARNLQNARHFLALF